jgi:hypothetical protein
MKLNPVRRRQVPETLVVKDKHALGSTPAPAEGANSGERGSGADGEVASIHDGSRHTR